MAIIALYSLACDECGNEYGNDTDELSMIPTLLKDARSEGWSFSPDGDVCITCIRKGPRDGRAPSPGNADH